MVTFVQGAPAVVVGFGVESDFFLGGLGEIVEEDKVGGVVSWVWSGWVSGGVSVEAF